jgi:hypothetical protein
LEVNDASGNVFRGTYNDNNGGAANYFDLAVTSGGDLTVTPSGGDVSIVGSLAIGSGGAPILKVLTGTGSLDFAQASANACETLTLTVTGAADGDVVELGIPHALANHNTTATFAKWRSASNTVSVRRCVIAADGSDPAAATVRATVIQH